VDARWHFLIFFDACSRHGVELEKKSCKKSCGVHGQLMPFRSHNAVSILAMTILARAILLYALLSLFFDAIWDAQRRHQDDKDAFGLPSNAVPRH
jgi:hypothetical protein